MNHAIKSCSFTKYQLSIEFLEYLRLHCTDFCWDFCNSDSFKKVSSYFSLITSSIDSNENTYREHFRILIETKLPWV